MNTMECRIKLPHHLGKRRRKRRAPPDQHVVMAAAQRDFASEPYDLPQTPPHPVALDSIADLL